MNMTDYYKMTIRQSIDLRDTVTHNGYIAGTKFNRETYRNNILVNYNGDIFQIDSQLGIVDINDTAKEVQV